MSDNSRTRPLDMLRLKDNQFAWKESWVYRSGNKWTVCKRNILIRRSPRSKWKVLPEMGDQNLRFADAVLPVWLYLSQGVSPVTSKVMPEFSTVSLHSTFLWFQFPLEHTLYKDKDFFAGLAPGCTLNGESPKVGAQNHVTLLAPSPTSTVSFRVNREALMRPSGLPGLPLLTSPTVGPAALFHSLLQALPDQAFANALSSAWNTQHTPHTSPLHTSLD